MKSLYPLQDTPWECRPRKTSAIRNSAITSHWVQLNKTQKSFADQLTPVINHIYNTFVNRLLLNRIKRVKIRHFRYDMNVQYIQSDVRKLYGNIPTYVFFDVLDTFLFELGALFDLQKTSSDSIWTQVYRELPPRRSHEKRRLHYISAASRLNTRSYPVTRNHVYVRPFGWLRLETPLPQSVGRIRYSGFGYEGGLPLVSLVKDTTSQDFNYIEVPFKFPVGLLRKLWEITKFTPEDDWFVTSLLKFAFKPPFKCNISVPENNYELYSVYIIPTSNIYNKWITLNEQEKSVVNAKLIKKMYMILNDVSKTTIIKNFKWDIMND